MLLCQICGLNIHEPILLIDENLEDVSTIIPSTQFDIETAYANRPGITKSLFAGKYSEPKSTHCKI